MTKVNNGRISSGNSSTLTRTKTSPSAKAAAVLAKLDEISVSLADEISHYGDDDDMSVMEEIAQRSSRANAEKKSMKASESKVAMLHNHDDKSHDTASNSDDSTVYEEISYSMARMNKKSKQTGLGKVDKVESEQYADKLAEKKGGPFVAEHMELKEKMSSRVLRQENKLGDVSIATLSSSIDEYVNSLSIDNDVLDNASILDETPKIRNNKKVNVSKKDEGSNLSQPHFLSETSSESSTKSGSIRNGFSEAKVRQTNKTDAHGSWGIFSRAASKTMMHDVESALTHDKTNSKHSKLSNEQHQGSQFHSLSHLSVDIESVCSRNRGLKRNNSPSTDSRVSSALSLDDETEDIIRSAIIINDHNATKRRRCILSSFLLVFLAAIFVLMALVHTNNVPEFIRGALNNLGVVSSSPTTEINADTKGVPGVMWYANFDSYKCVQDCDDISVTCEGKMKSWEQGFVTLEECCLENLSSFVGKDWSLRDCMSVSYTNPSMNDAEVSTGLPTYMPTADGLEKTLADDKGAAYPTVSGTTPWVTKNDFSDYVLDLDENFNPIIPTTPQPQNIEKLVTTTDLPIQASISGTSPWEGKGDKSINDYVSSGYILELDENYNPINPTTTAAASTNFEFQKITSTITTVAATKSADSTSPITTTEKLIESTIDASMAAIATSIVTPSTIAESYKSVYYADWDKVQCLLADPSTLQSWQKSYQSENDCCLENFDWDVNGHCFVTMHPATDLSKTQYNPTVQQTDQPTPSDSTNDDQSSLSPTFFPTLSPTLFPIENTTKQSRSFSNSPSEGIDMCMVEFCSYEITSDYLFEYRVNVPEDTSIDECSGCSLSIKLTYDDVTSWIGFAFSTTGQMVGSEAIIGAPGMIPAKYYLTGKLETQILPMEKNKQTLIDPKVEIIDGQTVLSFTKVLVEEGEIALSMRDNTFLWAHGTDIDTTYHGGNKGSFSIDLLNTNSPRSHAFESTKMEAAVSDPTVNPVYGTASPTNKLTGTQEDSLMKLLLTVSPDSAGNLADTTSAQYLAWRWLKTNPDLMIISDEHKIQRWVLATFYHSVHGDEWTNREGWIEINDNGVNECTWYNIMCDSSGFIVGIDLKNNYLWGDIPMEISLLYKCEYLGLSSNYLGIIQPEIFNMKSLKVLDMNDNGIEEIPFRFNPSLSLEELYLNHNKIRYIPDVIFGMKSLKILSIFDNWIASTLSSKIGQLKSLEVLDLETNFLTGQIPDELFQVTSLKEIWMYGNMLTGQISPNFSKMTNLNVLDLSQNRISGELPTQIGMFQNITELYLQNNMISGQLPTELSDLTSLRILDLSMNYLNSDIISEIGSLQNLVSLRFDHNYRLDENGTLISSGITGTIPSSIGKLKLLKDLRLDNNFIKGPLPSALGDLQSLENLQIESNDVHGSIPSHLGNVANLQYLHLWSNYIEGPIPTTLGNLVELKELFLDDNELTGSIPTELGRLANANYIALASNNLEGEIPSELGNLRMIEKLELQSNYLNGEVPKELGSSPLIVLHLEDNLLYGDIPQEICHGTIQYLSGSCPILPESTSDTALSAQSEGDPLTQASMSAQNGVRANSVRNQARTNRARMNGTNTSQRKNGSRQRTEQTIRRLAGTPASSPTLEYQWSCNCCHACLSV